MINALIINYYIHYGNDYFLRPFMKRITLRFRLVGVIVYILANAPHLIGCFLVCDCHSATYRPGILIAFSHSSENDYVLITCLGFFFKQKSVDWFRVDLGLRRHLLLLIDIKLQI